MKQTLATLAVVALLSGCTDSNAPSAPDNRAPVIDSLIVAPPLLRVGESATVTCYARDPDGDPLQYRWSASAGDLLPMGDGSRVGADWSPLVFSPRWVSGLSVQEGKSAYGMRLHR